MHRCEAKHPALGGSCDREASEHLLIEYALDHETTDVATAWLCAEHLELAPRLWPRAFAIYWHAVALPDCAHPSALWAPDRCEIPTTETYSPWQATAGDLAGV